MKTTPRASQSLYDKERIEVDHWLTSEGEQPGQESLHNLENKFGDVPVFLERVRAHAEWMRAPGRVLELGAGQGWASCALQWLLPASSEMFVTDISVHALRSLPIWERIFDRKMRGGGACRSYELPFRDASFDVIFTFQAAHHFVAHRRTLREIHRVLKPGGRCYYLHEPTCEAWIHPLAFRRVNAKRPDVPEDVMIHRRILALAREAGLDAYMVDDCSLVKRGTVEYFYYFLLGRIPPLRSLLPCTRDFVFSKPA